MKKFFAVLMLAAALILPGLAQAKDAQTSMIDDVVKRGVLRVGFSSFVPWAMHPATSWTSGDVSSSTHAPIPEGASNTDSATMRGTMNSAGCTQSVTLNAKER